VGSVLLALVRLTALLLAGDERYEDRLEAYSEQFPAISGAILVLIGIGFVAGSQRSSTKCSVTVRLTHTVGYRHLPVIVAPVRTFAGTPL
jgi:hypothetical protein